MSLLGERPAGLALEPDGCEAAGAPTSPRPDRRSLVLAGLVLALLVVGLVVSASTRATMAFGDSHDGRNAGMWAGRSRSLRENGPIESRLGTRIIVADRAVAYATHPPLIAVEAALAEIVLGERPWATRLPAWGGSLAALVLAFLLLRACCLPPVAAAVGVALGFGCPLFAAYGTMLDTTMVSLPFGIAVLWLWQRGRNGQPVHRAVVAVMSALAALTSWLGLLTVVLVAAATVLPRLRRRRRRLAPPEGGDVQPLGFVAGAGAGVVLVVAWIAWAYGSLQPVIDQLLVRSGAGGEEETGVGTFVAILRSYWSQTFTLWQLLLVVPALAAAVQRRTSRPVAIVLLVDMAVWMFGLRDGAVHHDYWAYWMVVPLALGIGVMTDALITWVHGRRGDTATVSGPAPRLPFRLVAVAGFGVVLGFAGVVAPSPSSVIAEDGAAGGVAVGAADYPPGQQRAWYLGSIIVPVDWIAYASRRPPAELLTPADVERLAEDAPEELVLVHGGRLRRDVRASGPNPGCRAGVPDGQTFVVLPAATLGANLNRPPSAACPAGPPDKP